MMKRLVCLILGHEWTDTVTEKETPYSSRYIRHVRVIEVRDCDRCGKHKEVG